MLNTAMQNIADSIPCSGIEDWEMVLREIMNAFIVSLKALSQ